MPSTWKTSRRTGLAALLAVAAVSMSGCLPLVLYGPRTLTYPETSVVSSPFKYVSLDCDANGVPYGISLTDPDSSKLKHLHFVSATVTNDDGAVTQLHLRSENLENPNTFVMIFHQADHLDHDLHFRVTLLSNGEPVVIVFQTRIKTKVIWPKDSDYSG